MKTKIILALDVNSEAEAFKVIDETFFYVDCFKVGSILYAESGNNVINYIKQKNKEVFLDLKFFDIPNTVKGVSKIATKIGVDMFTIHLLGGVEMIKAAIDGVHEAFEQCRLNNKPLILGVTILTSMNEDIIKRDLKIELELKDMILHLAKMGYENGLKGFVCSPHEISLLKTNLSKDIIVVTPGVRLEADEKGDQKRVMTPQMAMKEGADYIVVGRSVLTKPDKEEVLRKLKEELS
ncbi:MAG: orotidine-5'-phosphate decarboxylase [Brevinematales bacterium]|nr:orotidine-5'-phosphate decarboxylase [Brevinematales bacterium]